MNRTRQYAKKPTQYHSFCRFRQMANVGGKGLLHVVKMENYLFKCSIDPCFKNNLLAWEALMQFAEPNNDRMSMTERRRGPVVGRSLWTRPARVQSPGWDIIRYKNLALYIRDCESLCLSDETLSGVYARGSKRSHTGGKCVTCRGLHILT